MTDSLVPPDNPIEIWDNWPVGTLRRGDVIKVSWSYEGVHGPMWKEDIYLLLEKEKEVDGFLVRNDEEAWSALTLSEKDCNGERAGGELRRWTIFSSEFTQKDTEDWQRIALVARAEGGLET